MGRTIKLNCVIALTQINSALDISVFTSCLVVIYSSDRKKRHLQRRLEIKSFKGNGYRSWWPVGGMDLLLDTPCLRS